MKIAIAANGKDEESEVSPVSGRTPYILIFEGKKLIEVFKNPFAVGGGGAGISVAHVLAEKGVNLYIAGKFGPNVVDALKENNIEMKVIYNKKVKEVMEEL